MMKKLFLACVAIAMSVVAKAQTEMMVVEQTDGSKIEYEVSKVNRVYFYEQTPSVMVYSADSTEVTIYLDLLSDNYGWELSDSVTSARGTKKLIVVGDYSKMHLVGGRYNRNNAFLYYGGEIDFSGVTGWTEVPEYLFQGFNGTGIILPESVTKINSSAFQMCYGITYFKADGVTEVGDYAFYWLTNIGYKNLPMSECLSLNSVEKIGKKAFYGCEWLSELSFPKVTSIGEDAFSGCTRLKDLKLTAKGDIDVTSLGSDVTSKINLTLNADKKSEVENSVTWKGMTFASISFEE